MAFVVVYDACILYPAPLRDLVLRIAASGVVQARWSDTILDECFSAIIENRPELNAHALKRTRDLMNAAVRDARITGFEDLISGLHLPDPDDRHVLAAAIRAGAQAIVTFNLVDFPPSALAPFGIEPKHPDDFVLDTIDLAPAAIANILHEQTASLKNPPQSLSNVLDTLRDNGLVRSVARLRQALGPMDLG